MIGEAVKRLEDRRLITGAGKYVDDIVVDSMVHAVFVRSIEAHALIDSVGLDQQPPGVRLHTAADLGLERPVPIQNFSPVIAQPIAPPALATSEVCYVGQPIAVVTAESTAAAVDAAESVEVAYRPLPVTINHRSALDAGAPPVHHDGSSNLIAELSAGYGDAASALETAPFVEQFTVDQHRGALASLEGRGVMARWDEAEGTLTVWSSTQSPHVLRSSIATHLGLSPDEVRVITPDVGGGFGPKAAIHPEEYVVAALARATGRPVKWVERRREHFVATNQQRGQSGEVEVGFDGEGRVLALRARLAHDCGAYVPYGVVVPMTTLRLMSGPYALPNLDARIDCVFTNATPTGAIRGAGRPNATFILERAMDAIARRLGLSRAEVRRRNLIEPSALPYVVPIMGSDGRQITYDSGDYPAALALALEAADLDGFEDRRAGSEADGLLRGYGIASYVEDTGLGPYEGARIEILPDGDVIVDTGVSSQGQGHHTVFAQVCATELGVDPAVVRVHGGDTGRYGHGIGTVASRVGVTGASAVHRAAADLAATVRRLAADRLEAAPEDIVLAEGNAMVVGQPGSEIALAELASAAQPKFGGKIPDGQETPGLSAERVLPFAGLAFTYGTHVAEVEIDPRSGHIRVTGYVVVHDCGTLLNPMIVDGQIDGGVAHGLGNVLCEAVRYTEDGQPLSTSFMDYRLMTAEDMPDLVKVHVESPSPTSPLGAKGAGEGGTIPAAAAVVSAIEHALEGSGVRLHHYPVTPEWVVSALGVDGAG